ncbi:hypothetical protein MtrunA17_Chr6g0472851 [Medicago truncatula]|uniref:Transmembrane protein n=1 Tax=Medicago truncatula TaxID=3880 RepID=A0A396HGY2_MEDTR|nr:hypothetical protein MtrunA17_Chr6g0472851 [Medicago truncatula]
MHDQNFSIQMFDLLKLVSILFAFILKLGKLFDTSCVFYGIICKFWVSYKGCHYFVLGKLSFELGDLLEDKQSLSVGELINHLIICFILIFWV